MVRGRWRTALSGKRLAYADGSGGVPGSGAPGEAARLWLPALRRYLLVIAGGNLLWEFAHMPLYTLWQTGTAGEIAFAAVHCTGGDILIALSTLTAALLLVGKTSWPRERFVAVAGLAIAFGLAYTIFSEWLNIEVRGSWAYSDRMPVLPWLGAGLSPLMQWLVVPIAAHGWARGGGTRPRQHRPRAAS